MRSFFWKFVYLAYYVKELNWGLLAKFMKYVEAEKGWSRLDQWRRVVRDCMLFNISILEYYQFRFFELSDFEKAAWAGMGTMYEFQRRANPPGSREVLRDKRRFYQAYKQFFRHELYSLAELEANPRLLQNLAEKNCKLVFKEATGSCGLGVTTVRTKGLTEADILRYMKGNGFDLVESFVYQHPDLASLSPSAANTVRIFTQITSSGRYEVLGCRLRISVNSPVDNLAAGNMAAPIDPGTGVVAGPGVFSDITRTPAESHPVTGVRIIGFAVPYWQETLDLVREAALLHPQNRSIGWDVVITADGPGLIEGNHDWCKLVWQLPVNKGLKHLLDAG